MEATASLSADHDESANLLTQQGQPTNRAVNPGAPLAFTYTGR